MLLPGIVFGQQSILFPGAPPVSANTNLYTLAVGVASIILNAVWVVAVAFVIVMFVISGFKYLTAQGETGKVKEANQAIVWAVVGIIVIILAFSMISIIQRTISN